LFISAYRCPHRNQTRIETMSTMVNQINHLRGEGLGVSDFANGA
jgi:hypothetical protein